MKRTLLVVRGEGIASPFGVDEFDMPESLTLASEGFCPYHRDGPAVPVVVEPDGAVVCSQSGYRQTWEWTEEEVPYTPEALQAAREWLSTTVELSAEASA